MPSQRVKIESKLRSEYGSGSLTANDTPAENDDAGKFVVTVISIFFLFAFPAYVVYVVYLCAICTYCWGVSQS